MYAGTTAKVRLWPRLILRNLVMRPMHAVQNGWHVYPWNNGWLKIKRPLDNYMLYLGELDSDATKTSSRRLVITVQYRALPWAILGESR
jgi:hypothetical protein